MKHIVCLAQITDSHIYADDNERLKWTSIPVFPNKSLKRVLEKLTEEAKTFSALIYTGDLVQQETKETYQRLNSIFEGFPLKVYAIPGNHDVPKILRETLGRPFQLVEQTKMENWNLFFMDTNCGEEHGELSEKALAGLEKALSRLPKNEHAVIFMHHHPVEIESEWLDKTILVQRNAFWKIVDRHPQVKAVFHGHIHQEFEGTHLGPEGRNVPVFGTPATCIQVKPKTKTVEFDHPNPAWRIINLHDDGRVETRVNYL